MIWDFSTVFTFYYDQILRNIWSFDILECIIERYYFQGFDSKMKIIMENVRQF